MSTIRVGDIGAAIELTVYENGSVKDISSLVSATIYLRKPSQTVVSFTGTLSNTGTDGKLRYVTTDAADIDEEGEWEAQAYINLPSWQGRTSVGTFVAEALLA